ncbi:thioesterase domain-containing protein [Streptomyces albidoflavus]|uniref:thioesterase domain-containing protein n=1 Tax=Streptomyces albidoflavus TaxID=1886 RepID=UPI0035272807
MLVPFAASSQKERTASMSSERAYRRASAVMPELNQNARSPRRSVSPGGTGRVAPCGGVSAASAGQGRIGGVHGGTRGEEHGHDGPHGRQCDVDQGLPPPPAPGAPEAVPLVCFPHAGGSASYFHGLSRLLSPAVEVLAVQYPGRLPSGPPRRAPWSSSSAPATGSASAGRPGPVRRGRRRRTVPGRPAHAGSRRARRSCPGSPCGPAPPGTARGASGRRP